jgi:hypothetical protein
VADHVRVAPEHENVIVPSARPGAGNRPAIEIAPPTGSVTTIENA